MLFLLVTLLTAFLLCGRKVGAAPNTSSSPLLRGATSDIQALMAITVRSEHERRDIDFAAKYTLEHHYADRIYSLAIEERILVTGSLS
jgi:hypothetical protein